MCKVILVRPGRTNFDDQNRIQGSLDLPMNEVGVREVNQLIDSLREESLDLILSSTNDPARTTAETLGDSLGVAVKQCQGLDNLGQGLWEGLEVEEARRKYSKAYTQWEGAPDSVCPPEGETVDDVRLRVAKSLKKPLRKKKCIAVVAAEPLASLVRQMITQQEEYTINFHCKKEIEFGSIELLTPVSKEAL